MDETESVTDLEFDYDATTIVGRQENSREAILRAREEANKDLRSAWEQYLKEYPIDDDTARHNAQLVFEAYATSDAVRNAIDSKRSGRLEGTTLQSAAYRATPEEHRIQIVRFITEKLLARNEQK